MAATTITSRATGVAALAAACLAMGPQQPTFRTATDVIRVDTYVVGRDGAPIPGLKPEQFEVLIDGRRHPVLFCEYLPGGQSSAEASAIAAPATTPGAAAASFGDGRVFVIGIDQPSFPMVAQASAREAVRRVLDSVAPEDYVGLVAFPGRLTIAPTRDRSPIRKAVDQIQGLRSEIRTRSNISLTEAVAIKANDSMTVRDVTQRECGMSAPMDCQTRVRMDASQITTDLLRQGSESIGGLHSVIDGMAVLPGRKTLLIISAGIPMSHRVGSNLGLETDRVAARAASANVNLYVFYMNVHFLRAFSAEFGRINNTLFEDMGVFGLGLEKFAAGASGAFFQIEVDSDPFVARVMRETSAYYLLTVAPEPRERDGKAHFIRVAVKERGATVRHRTVVTIPSR